LAYLASLTDACYGGLKLTELARRLDPNVARVLKGHVYFIHLLGYHFKLFENFYKSVFGDPRATIILAFYLYN